MHNFSPGQGSNLDRNYESATLPPNCWCGPLNQQTGRRGRERVPAPPLAHLSAPLRDVRASRSVCVPAPRQLPVVDSREEEELSKFPRPGKLSSTAQIKKITPFPRVRVKRSTGSLPWNDGAAPGASSTRWRPASRRGSDSPLCSACAAVLWRNAKVCPGIAAQGRGCGCGCAGAGAGCASLENLGRGPLFPVRHLHKSKKNHRAAQKAAEKLDPDSGGKFLCARVFC